jgi:hypothetical protein
VVAQSESEQAPLCSASAADSISEIPIRPYAFAPLPQIEGAPFNGARRLFSKGTLHGQRYEGYTAGRW